MATVRELRVVLTVKDFEAALGFYRDALGDPDGMQLTLFSVLQE
jgi:hypothetical protein